jgi:hypothetical protein
MSTRIDAFYKALILGGRATASLVLVVAGLSGPARAVENPFENHYGRYEYGHHQSGGDDFCRHMPTPQPGGQPHSNSVPEIDAGAAVCGLALLAGTVMLLRDRALAR